MQSLGQDYLATGSQVKYWPSRVHPWRLHRMHPWWWDRDVWDKKVWTWRGHVEILLKTCRTFPIIVIYDNGLLQGNRFGQSWTHFVRYNGGFGHWLLLWKVYYLVKISCKLGKYIWEFINHYHLGVPNVGERHLGCWVLQGMGQFVRRDDAILRGRIVREWSIVWGKSNTVSVTLSSSFSKIYMMAHIVIHGRTKIPPFHSMWFPSASHCCFFMENHLCSRRG